MVGENLQGVPLTRLTFLRKLREAFESSYCWAREDQVKLDRIILQIIYLITTETKPAAVYHACCYQAAWKASGGEGDWTWEKMVALPIYRED